jgi:hypothetical protein
MIFLNLELNIHFGLSTSHIINFQFLTFSEIQFWSQVFFFFGPWFEREERKWSDSSKKTGDFSVNEFSFYGESLYKVFFSLKLAWDDIFEPENVFSYGLIVGFKANFWVVRGYDMFYKVFRVFFCFVFRVENEFFLVWNKLVRFLATEGC